MPVLVVAFIDLALINVSFGIAWFLRYQLELGYQIVGFVDDEPRQSLGRLQYLGRCGDVSRLVGDQDIDEVLISLPSESHRAISEILMACARQRVSFRIVPDFFELSLNQ